MERGGGSKRRGVQPRDIVQERERSVPLVGGHVLVVGGSVLVRVFHAGLPLRAR